MKITDATLDRLDNFRVDVDPDRNADPYLICGRCGVEVCTVEHDDTLAVLARTALDHDREQHPEEVEDDPFTDVLDQYDVLTRDHDALNGAFEDAGPSELSQLDSQRFDLWERANSLLDHLVTILRAPLDRRGQPVVVDVDLPDPIIGTIVRDDIGWPDGSQPGVVNRPPHAEETTCRHCGRGIVKDAGDRWVDPEATGDDSTWRETCDENHEDRIAAHEPLKEATP